MPDHQTPAVVKSIALPILKWMSRSRAPKLDGSINLAGLSAPVEIRRDTWGVPHINAKSIADGFFAQAFVHAQDRLWQMEFNRRLISGRLSEIIGKPAIDVDRWMRTLTMRRVAEYEVRILDDKSRSLLQAYANGVNAFLASGKLPIEFSLLRYRPEPWMPADTLAWIKLMSWSLSVNWETEILRAKIIEKAGPEIASQIDPYHLDRWPLTIPNGADFSKIGLSALERAAAVRPFSGPSPYEGVGSNNWVLGGQRTVSGKPLLANDMHLAMSIPAIWYENHLSCDEFNLTGVTFPGIPGVVSGHNDHIAWGFTNGFPDVQDLYMEHIQRTPDGKVLVEFQGQWEQARVLHEVIEVKGSPAVTEEVIITRHGPIINALSPDFIGEMPLALRWTSLEPDTMARWLTGIPFARSCEEVHQAFEYWTAPVQNVVYADVNGNIGYTLPGKIPVRAKGDGRVPVPGWSGEYEWNGYLAYDTLPHIINPENGFIATANNRTVDENYPVPLVQEPISGDRIQRIVELIQQATGATGAGKIDIPYIQKMHFDLVSPSARIVAREISAIKSTGKPILDAIILNMATWDAKLAPESKEAAVYQVFIHKLLNRLLEDKLGDLTIRYQGKGPVPLLAEGSLFGERWLGWLTLVLEEADNPWLGSGERRNELLTAVLEETVEYLSKTLGTDPSIWAWGKIHRIAFQHSLGSSPLLHHLFDRGPFPLGGDSTTIWATGASHTDFSVEQVVGPPFRMIIDLADFGRSVSLLTPGQSGNPTSIHYDDQLLSWFNAGYHPMLFNRQDIEKETRHKLELLP